MLWDLGKALGINILCHISSHSPLMQIELKGVFFGEQRYSKTQSSSNKKLSFFFTLRLVCRIFASEYKNPLQDDSNQRYLEAKGICR